ncbi:SAM-dependent methyltransferase [Paenibacillus faecis]|uniref:class I SAM-dependent methyltransferase n=1 Tax=Paenibacillus faecis TaxID=862114 RepID=UPI001B1CA7EE|nr:class I SAM-dependent methyltransferase [Paenibacillus faecis]GIO88523.1 SAM-dependent methyltransferase [Paenibacillus faecis]
MSVTQNIRRFEKQAVVYDKKREKRELGTLRRRLLDSASGKVLELGIGAGSNLPFYRKEIRLTGVDFSPAMLERAKAANDRLYGIEANFIQSDIDTLELKENSYDTIVSTLTLCAYRDPGKVLRRMSRWCKPGGRILLLEHGLSSNSALAFGQKLVDPLVYRFVGCHHNRDIMKLVADSPLQVQHAEHVMTGMVHLIWCEPPVSDQG